MLRASFALLVGVILAPVFFLFAVVGCWMALYGEANWIDNIVRFFAWFLLSLKMFEVFLKEVKKFLEKQLKLVERKEALKREKTP